jgi:hypothetical protein
MPEKTKELEEKLVSFLEEVGAATERMERD